MDCDVTWQYFIQTYSVPILNKLSCLLNPIQLQLIVLNNFVFCNM